MSALTYGQVLYLLPISLFGMAVAAAELPELSRLGRGPAARPSASACTSALERITFYVAITVALYVFAGDVVVGALLQRGEFDRRRQPPRVVRHRRVRARASSAPPARACSRTASTPSTGPSLVARIAVVRVALAAALGALLMFPFDRLAIVGSSVQRIGDLGFGPLPDSLRLAGDGPPRLGVVGPGPRRRARRPGSSTGCSAGALEWRIGRAPAVGHDAPLVA